MSSRLAPVLLALLALGSSACLDPQFVNPGTVELNIRRAEGGPTLVSHCNYIPVLLGSTVHFSYAVDDNLVARLEITRENVKVSFEDSSGWLGSFGAPSATFVAGFSLEDPDPPPGFAATLRAGCEPSPAWPDR